MPWTPILWFFLFCKFSKFNEFLESVCISPSKADSSEDLPLPTLKYNFFKLTGRQTYRQTVRQTNKPSQQQQPALPFALATKCDWEYFDLVKSFVSSHRSIQKNSDFFHQFCRSFYFPNLCHFPFLFPGFLLSKIRKHHSSLLLNHLQF